MARCCKEKKVKKKIFETEKRYTLALVGNPNSGKTTLFNELTKSNQHIGNWPGVTIEHKSGRYHKDKSVEIIDLPGIYSLTPLSVEEVISRNYIIDEKPDMIINVVDSTNLERNLYLTTQLMALDVNIVIALNMKDEAEKKGIDVDTLLLSNEFNVPVVEISALKKKGLDELMQACENMRGKIPMNRKYTFSDDVEAAIGSIEERHGVHFDDNHIRWHMIKLFEKDKVEYEKHAFSKEEQLAIESVVKPLEEKYAMRSDSIIATMRYNDISDIVDSVVKTVSVEKPNISDKIDKIVTNKWLAFPIFALVMFLVFFISIQTIGDLTVQGMNWIITSIQDGVSDLMKNAPAWSSSLVVDGIIGGVGSVVQYVPQIMILFGMISILEACGYMSRVAFIMDRIFRGLGLSGKSFIPLIIGCGCTVPAIMGARVIKNEKERNATIMIAPFVPCSAKLAMFSFFTATIFGGNALAATSMYFVGILVAIGVAYIAKLVSRSKVTADDTFVIELPPYRVPKPRNVLFDMWERGKAFLIKAGTIIFIASIILWFLQTFSFSFKMVDAGESILASIGKVIAPIFIPLGFGRWELAVSSITGVTAKEVVITTMEILGITSANASEYFTTASGYSFMVFNLLFSTCLAGISATFRELGSVKKGFIALGVQIVTSYIVALVFYQMGRLATVNAAAFWSILTVLIVLVGVLIAVKIILSEKKKKKCATGCIGCPHSAACGKVEVMNIGEFSNVSAKKAADASIADVEKSETLTDGVLLKDKDEK